MRRLGALSDVFFSNGCFFFLPYLVVYGFAWLVRLPVPALTASFGALHALNLLLLGLYAYRHRSQFRLVGVLFWSCLALLFLLPGAYLEYPSDAWTHFWRIYRWLNIEVVGDHPSHHKFAYFWGYSLLHDVSPADRRVALGLYSAFWQMLVAVQVHALARRLGFDETGSKLQVVAFIFFFGTSVFGLRYYALSSTPLAYVAYLRILICSIDFLDWGRLLAAVSVPPLVVLAWANHEQEVLFSAIGVGTLLLLAWVRSLEPARRRQLFRDALPLLLVSVMAGTLVRRYAPQLYEHMFLDQVTLFGGFAIWRRIAFLETYGVHGIAALGLALLFFRRHPRLAVMTLMPTFFLLFPPTALLFSSLVNTGNVAHRILYAFPTSFMLIYGLRELIAPIASRLDRPRARGWSLGTTAAVALLLAAPGSYPWRGRLPFALHQPPRARTLAFADQTAQWFLEHRDVAPDCRIVSDVATEFAVATHLGLRQPARPIQLRSYARVGGSREQLPKLIGEGDVCGVLVGIRARLPNPPPSALTASSGHWVPRLANPRWLTGRTFTEAAERLTQVGWTRTPVPPFYFLYEPPN